MAFPLHSELHPSDSPSSPWNKGRLIGRKPPLKPREIWGIRIRLHLAGRLRDLALFNLAVDSKLRGCDLVSIRVRDVVQGGRVISRAMVLQRKTQQPVEFEITEHARDAISTWKERARLGTAHYLFPSRLHGGGHITTRQYSRLVKSWVSDIGLDSALYGTHSLRRTKATLIYRRTKNLRAVQLLLGHTKLDYLPCQTMSRRAVTHRSGRNAAGHSLAREIVQPMSCSP